MKFFEWIGKNTGFLVTIALIVAIISFIQLGASMMALPAELKEGVHTGLKNMTAKQQKMEADLESISELSRITAEDLTELQDNLAKLKCKVCYRYHYPGDCEFNEQKYKINKL